MRDAGVKGTKEYSYYDPTQGENSPTPAEGRYLGPKEIVKALTDYGRKEESEPSSLRRFFQEQSSVSALACLTYSTSCGGDPAESWRRSEPGSLGERVESQPGQGTAGARHIGIETIPRSTCSQSTVLSRRAKSRT